MSDEVLHTQTNDFPWRTTVDVWESVLVKTEKVGKDLHFLPQHQCPKCGDIGQECYPDPDYRQFGSKNRWIFYCPYCYVHYRMRYRQMPKPGAPELPQPRHSYV